MMIISTGDHIEIRDPLKEEGIQVRVEGHLMEEDILIGMEGLLEEDPLMVEDILMEMEDPLMVEGPQWRWRTPWTPQWTRTTRPSRTPGPVRPVIEQTPQGTLDTSALENTFKSAGHSVLQLAMAQDQTNRQLQ